MRQNLSRLIFVVLALFVGTGFAQSSPQNLNFEKGEIGGLPQGWKATTPHGGANPGYTVKLTHEQAKEGTYCAELASSDGERAQFGNLMQSFDATAYRGKRVRFRAAVRTEGLETADRAQLWLRVDRQGDEVGFFDNMGDRPIREKDWGYYEIIGDIDRDAERVNIGVILIGAGKVWIDDASFQVLGDSSGLPLEPARPLTSRALQNEIAFARLYGLVRYFHPSDQAARTEWNAFVIRGVREVEGARNDAELARKLTSLFAPVAPTLRVLPGASKYSPPVELLPPKDAADLKIIYWRHNGLGVGKGESKVYHSERIQESTESIRGHKVPLPGSPWKADLGGVTAWVPLALYVDAKGTLPRATEVTPDSATSGEPAWSADDRGTRLADVIIAWNVFEHFYPYFDVVQTDWSAVLPKALKRAAGDKDASAFNDTLLLLIADLHDGHGSLSKGGFTAALPLRWDWIEEKLVITAVGESAKGKISPGDVVLKIDGRSAAEALSAQEALVSGATTQWIRYCGLQNLMRGRKGQAMNLTIEPFAQPGKTSEISLSYEVASSPVEEHRPSKIAEIEPGIYYIDIGRISEADFKSALPQLEKAHGIVFDFRGYPSLGPVFLTHLSQQKLSSEQWHIPIVLWPDRVNLQFEHTDWQLDPAQPLLTAKRAFITDGRAISYAETCMGIIEYYKLGAIVGAPTAGTNGNVNPFTLPGGYSIMWTGMKVLKQDGSRHHGVGIIPTIPVSRTRAGVAAGHDEFLERAVKAVKD